MEIIADAQAKAREILLSGKDQLYGEAQLTSDGITQKVEFQERKRLSNVKAVISHSAALLTNREVDDHTPDADWTARFFDCVQDISSEDLQKLWARLLSGEVERPGSTSLRTMDVLRSMTEAEAHRFQSLCSFVLKESSFFVVIYGIDTIDQFPELSYGNLLQVQDCGLLNLGVMSFNFTESNCLMSHKYILRVVGICDRKVAISVANLTRAGGELFRISETPLNEQYLRAMARHIRDNHRGCQLHYAPILQRLSGKVQYQSFKPVL